MLTSSQGSPRATSNTLALILIWSPCSIIKGFLSSLNSSNFAANFSSTSGICFWSGLAKTKPIYFLESLNA